MSETVVRLQALDGQWETCGADRLRGIFPEPPTLTANDWGPDTARFVLRRDPGAIYPDLSAFTPCEIDVEGEMVWDGRVWETPSKDGDDAQIAVEGRGFQYHLDDDVYRRVYVHSKVSDWRDARSFLGCVLPNFVVAGQVANDKGISTLSFQKDSAIPAQGAVGVVLDLGASLAKRISVDWESSNNASAVSLFARAIPIDNSLHGLYDEAFTFTLGSGVSGTTSGSFATGYRYVHVFLYWGAGGTPTTADVYAKLKGIRVYTDTAYESGDQSVLKATDVVKDARNRGTILLSPSNDLIEQTTFPVPEFALDGSKSPREVIDAINAYHAYRTRVVVGRLLQFGAQPASPLFEVGEWSGAEFEDAAMGSGEPIYSRVLVEGDGPDGEKLSIERTQGQQPGNLNITAISSPAPDNPSFATNLASWTASTPGNFTRDTVDFDTSPASGKWVPTAGFETLEETFSGTFVAGITYRLEIRLKASSPSFEDLRFGTDDDYGFASVVADTGYATYVVAWTPKSNRTGVKLRISMGGGVTVHIDTLALFTVTATIVERRGFRRTKILPVSSSLTNAMGNQIGDTYLSNHRTTPLKGTLKVTGRGGVRRVLGGQPVHPAHLLKHTTEKLRLSHRTDPDNGGQGRDGVVASVSFDGSTDASTVAIDSERTNFEALLARLAVVTGQGT